MHGPLNVKLPKTAYGASLVEHWVGVDHSSRKKKPSHLTATCSVWGVKPLCSCTRELPCSCPFSLCNVLTIAEVLLLTVMLGFSHRTVLLYPFWASHCMLGIVAVNTTRLYTFLMLMFYGCEEVHVDVVIGTCLCGKLMTTSIGL